MLLLLDLNDILIALIGNDLNKINLVKRLLHDKLTIKDLGNVKYFLGMAVVRSHKGIALF